MKCWPANCGTSATSWFTLFQKFEGPISVISSNILEAIDSWGVIELVNKLWVNCLFDIGNKLYLCFQKSWNYYRPYDYILSVAPSSSITQIQKSKYIIPLNYVNVIFPFFHFHATRTKILQNTYLGLNNLRKYNAYFYNTINACICLLRFQNSLIRCRVRLDGDPIANHNCTMPGIFSLWWWLICTII